MPCQNVIVFQVHILAHVQFRLESYCGIDCLYSAVRIHISGVTKCVTKFLTLSKSPHCDSVKNFVTHFVTPEIWTLMLYYFLDQKGHSTIGALCTICSATDYSYMACYCLWGPEA